MVKQPKSIKSLFLIDAIGATFSTILLGGVLVHFHRWIGMPVRWLYLLAGLAAVCMLYSWVSFTNSHMHQPCFVKLLAKANMGYLTLTLMVVLCHLDVLTQLGVLYFLVEGIILIFLVYKELKTAANN